MVVFIIKKPPKKLKIKHIISSLFLIIYSSFSCSDYSVVALTVSEDYRIIKQSDFNRGEKILGRVDCYISESGKSYKIGDFITVGEALGDTFKYIKFTDKDGETHEVLDDILNQKLVIMNIRARGDRVIFKASLLPYVKSYLIYIDDCIASGEIIE